MLPSKHLTAEKMHTVPAVLNALQNPRSARSVLNYMCACDTTDPESRMLLSTEEFVDPLLNIWFASGTLLDDLCQPFAEVVRELKAAPPTLVDGDWDTVEGKVAKVLLADQLSMDAISRVRACSSTAAGSAFGGCFASFKSAASLSQCSLAH